MSAPAAHPVEPSAGECGIASWEPADLAALLLPAWDEFADIAGSVDLDAPSRVRGWTARDVCVHLGSWPGARTLERMRAEAEADDLDLDDPRAGTFDLTSHNEAVIDARAAAPRAEVVAALHESRAAVAAFLSSDEVRRLGLRRVRSVLGPLPLTTLVAAGGYELAVHALDLQPAGAPAPSPALLSAGAACLTPEGGWAFASTPSSWSTLELPAVPGPWPTVLGDAADLLDGSAGRRAVPPMLARRDLRVHHVAGLLALAPIVEAVPGLPGGAALRVAVRNLRTVSRFMRRIPGVPG